MRGGGRGRGGKLVREGFRTPPVDSKTPALPSKDGYSKGVHPPSRLLQYSFSAKERAEAKHQAPEW